MPVWFGGFSGRCLGRSHTAYAKIQHDNVGGAAGRHPQPGKVSRSPKTAPQRGDKFMELDFSKREELRQFIESRFSLHELKTLAFDLSIDYEIFEHQSKPAFVLDLLQYFDRRNRLSCLITAILRLREAPQLLDMLPALSPCVQFNKVIVIIPQKLLENWPDFREDLSNKLEISPDEVKIVSAISGSLQLLIGLPDFAAEVFINSRITSLCDGSYKITSIKQFASLSNREKNIWRAATFKSPPIRRGDSLIPTITMSNLQVQATNLRTHQFSLPSLSLLPPFPNTTNIHDVTCVSCREKFKVAKNQKDSAKLWSEFSIYCPRCEADNSQWIELNTLYGLSIINFWRKYLPQVFRSYYFAFLFSLLGLFLAYTAGVSTPKILLLIVSSPILVTGIIWELTRDWNRLRENKHLKRINPTVKDTEITLWLKSFFILVVFAFIFPIIFFEILPATSLFTIGQVRDGAINFDWLSAFNADIRYLSIWGMVIGLLSLVTISITISAVKQFMIKIDKSLPPPIFYSLANMTRMVVREANRASHLGDRAVSIQWLSAARNKVGGLDLVGRYRPQINIDEQSTSGIDTITGQEYTISTDLWGRIIKAQIEDVNFPVGHEGPSLEAILIPDFKRKLIWV